MNLKLAFALAPYALILALLVGIAWLRGDKIKAEADVKTWRDNSKAWQGATESANKSLATVNELRKSNDDIQKSVNGSLASIRATANQTRAAIQEVYRNDPAAIDWANVPIPNSLRAIPKEAAPGPALRSNSDR